MKFGQSCFILALTAFSSVASAGFVPMAADDFQAYSTGDLSAQNGGTGWSGAWTAVNTVVQVVDPASDLQGNRAISFAGDSASAASRTMLTTLSGDVLIDFQIQFLGAVNDNDFLGLWFGSNLGTNIGLKGNCGGPPCAGGQDFFVRTTGSGGSVLAGSNITVGTTYHIFAHLYKAGNGNYDRFDAWLDPTALEMATLANPDATFSGSSNISSFDTIGFRSANLDGGDAVLIDNIRIQAVPEPGSLALMGLALAGLAGIRRRKSI